MTNHNRIISLQKARRLDTQIKDQRLKSIWSSEAIGEFEVREQAQIPFDKPR